MIPFLLFMKTVLVNLLSADKWEEFYNDRIDSCSLSDKQAGQLRVFIDNKGYEQIARGILDGNYEFSIPRLTYISKGGSNKKRIVYRFVDDELWILKHIAFLMHRYDERFSDVCYSFRRGKNARTAVRDILSVKGINSKYCLKADIHDYFNSIPRDRLCDKLSRFIDDDDILLHFLTDLLSTDMAVDPDTGSIIRGNRGAMAGTPLSPFLANLYMLDLDRHFAAKDIVFLRYADDFLVFADDRDMIIGLRAELFEMIHDEGLVINEEKSSIIEPGKAWEFLGIKYDNGGIDISDNTKRKIKAKIKRKAHALYRWRLKKKTTFEQTAFVMIRTFNNKFYDTGRTGDFSWSKWFFPIINTDRGLSEIDRYLLGYIRYLNKGRHYKGNYRISYDDIKSLGFRSLRAEYYAGKGIENNASV